tara:strand:- start:246 stop:434 length:189 start_codon:yes stop_codon:yes gene_type:complete
MKNLPFFILLILGMLFPANSSYAHLYDSIGVEAGDHTHEGEENAPMKDSKCFDDAKFGKICK